MTDSINERFKTFISQLPSAEVIDELELPSEFDESKGNIKNQDMALSAW